MDRDYIRELHELMDGVNIAQFHASSDHSIQTIEVLSYDVYKKNEEDIFEELYSHDYEKPLTFNMADIPKK